MTRPTRLLRVVGARSRLTPALQIPLWRVAMRPSSQPKWARTDSNFCSIRGGQQQLSLLVGDDPGASVVNRFCRLHDADNVFVVDSSFMPTGLGLNPMVTVVANALRVGTTSLMR